MAGLLPSVVLVLAVLGGLHAQDATAPQVITLPGGQTFVLPAPAANNLDLVNNNNVYNNVSTPDATPVVVDNVIQPVAPVVVERQNPPTVVVTPAPTVVVEPSAPPTVVVAPSAPPTVVVAPTAAAVVPQQVGWTWGMMPLGGLLGARTLGLGFGGLGGLGGLGVGGLGLGGLGLGGVMFG